MGDANSSHLWASLIRLVDISQNSYLEHWPLLDELYQVYSFVSFFNSLLASFSYHIAYDLLKVMALPFWRKTIHSEVRDQIKVTSNYDIVSRIDHFLLKEE